MKLLKDRVLIRPIPPEEYSKGGLAIPESAQKPPQQGVVVECGPGMENVPMDVEKGDTILHLPGAGMEFELDGEEYLLLRSLDIVMIL